MGVPARGGQRTCVVVGAGPAGLMAAEVLAASGHAVTVFDQMPSVGRKFLMAGRGGLNLTHTEPLHTFLTRYGQAAAPLSAAIEHFPPAQVVAWCEGLSQETFAGSSGRVFPKSFKSSPLLRAWLGRLSDAGVVIRTHQRWLGWDRSGALLFSGPGGIEECVKADAVVLALGGASWPRLGSTGQWRSILQATGVAVAPFEPSNCGVRIAWSALMKSRFAGEPLKRIALTCGGETRRGEAIITRDGMEGGAIYALARSFREALQKNETIPLTIDLRPDETHEQIKTRLSGFRGRQSMATFLRKALKLTPVSIALLHEATGGPLPADQMQRAELIKAVPVTVTGLAGLERAISSSGGVPFDALDENLMLRVRPGVFLAGEMLDWDAPTGGYLLQACFATGVKAAQGAVAWLGSGTGAGEQTCAIAQE